ncbi:hypothetical protein P9112_013887 [Eukaryota sp. TZLM1-RC]
MFEDPIDAVTKVKLHANRISKATSSIGQYIREPIPGSTIPNGPSKKTLQRKERMNEIERQNYHVHRRCRSTKPSIPKKERAPLKRVPKSDLPYQQIEQENMRLLKKLQTVKPTISHQELKKHAIDVEQKVQRFSKFDSKLRNPLL